MKDRAWLEIDAQALKHNLKKIEEYSGRSKIMAVVKDQAYGLGLDAVFLMQELGIDYFAVATIDEAIELRSIGIIYPILIFGYTHPSRFNDLVTYDITQTVVSIDYFEDLVSFNKPLNVHLKINTGMNRLGITCDVSIVEKLFNHSTITVTGIYTHLLSADQPGLGHDKAIDQLTKFDLLLNQLDSLSLNYGITHVLNSAGIVFFGQSHSYDYVRPGLILASSGGFDDLRNVLSLKARIAMVKHVEAHQNVGYGIENVLNHPSDIATVTIGYGDGLSRALGKLNYEILVNNTKCPIVGRICMDQLLIDVSQVKVKQDDIASLLYDGFDVNEMAQLLDTIPNEILTHFTSRLERILVNEDRSL